MVLRQTKFVFSHEIFWEHISLDPIYACNLENKSERVVLSVDAFGME